MPEEAPEKTAPSESDKSHLVYKLREPFQLDGRTITELSLDFSSMKSKKLRELASQMSRKVDQERIVEFLSAPQIFPEYRLGLVAKVNGIIFDDLDNNLGMIDTHALGNRVASFLMQ